MKTLARQTKKTGKDILEKRRIKKEKQAAAVLQRRRKDAIRAASS